MATGSAANPSIYDVSLTREQQKKNWQRGNTIVNENEDED